MPRTTVKTKKVHTAGDYAGGVHLSFGNKGISAKTRADLEAHATEGFEEALDKVQESLLIFEWLDTGVCREAKFDPADVNGWVKRNG